MKKLPIGINTLSKIREQNCYYVDKTQFVEKLFCNGNYYFLSRPRRFGKSLFIDTLKEAFMGNKELFRGLYLENNWDWTKKYPVINLSFGGGLINNSELFDKVIIERLDEISKDLQIKISNQTISGRFREIIIEASKKYSLPVVILVDE